MIINEIKLFIDDYTSRLAPTTLSHYQKAITKFLEYTGKPYNQVTSRDIRNWLSELEMKGKKTSYRNIGLSGLKLFYRHCMEEDMVQSDPAKSIPFSKVEDKLPYYLSMEQLTRLRELAKDAQYYRVVVELLYTTGIRISELSTMKKEDINWSERSIVITKGKRKMSRIVLFTRECGEQLSRYLEGRKDDMPTVLVNTTGNGPICHRTVQKKIAKYGDQLGVKITPHTLRHTFAAHLAMKGMPLSCIQVLLGHEELKHTQLYARLYDHARKEIYDQFM